jgi:hypothetical protein
VQGGLLGPCSLRLWLCLLAGPGGGIWGCLGGGSCLGCLLAPGHAALLAALMAQHARSSALGWAPTAA